MKIYQKQVFGSYTTKSFFLLGFRLTIVKCSRKPTKTMLDFFNINLIGE